MKSTTIKRLLKILLSLGLGIGIGKLVVEIYVWIESNGVEYGKYSVYYIPAVFTLLALIIFRLLRGINNRLEAFIISFVIISTALIFDMAFIFRLSFESSQSSEVFISYFFSRAPWTYIASTSLINALICLAFSFVVIRRNTRNESTTEELLDGK